MQEEKNSIQATPSCLWSEEQREAVREELGRILAHHAFRNSARCSEFFAYVVNRALDGEEDEIKERILGIKVFERDPDYDIGSDPVVRRFASEVRKRIAQYYSDTPEDHRVKIQMPRGGYVPECEFFPSDSQRLPGAQCSPTEEASTVATLAKRRSTSIGKRHFRQFAFLALCAFALLAAAGLAFRSTNPFGSPTNRIWKPILATKATVIICLTDRKRRQPPPLQEEKTQSLPETKNKAHVTGISASQPPFPSTPDAKHGEVSNLSPNIMFGDMIVGNSIADFLTGFRKHYELRAASEFKYSDAQRGPIILIGYIRNNLAPALLSNVRYSIQYDTTNDDGWIRDAKDPARREWKGKAIPERWHEAQDYAVITRVFNEETGQWIIALTGIGGHGTQAAARLVTDPRLARMLPGYIRDSGNFQIVLRTTVIGEEPGPIQIVAGYTW